MKKISTFYYAIIGVVVVIVSGALFTNRTKDMNEIKFRLNNNIVETARGSGIPQFSTRNVDGLVSYGIDDMPSDIAARYDVPGYEVNFGPLFAFTMYADESNKNNLAVENVTLQFSSKPYKTHEEARKFAEKIIAEMNHKKWRRHISETCPAVTGRSAFLDAGGHMEKIASCSLDPHYNLTHDEWLKLMKYNASYQWLGENVLATFKISYSEDSRGTTYNFLMELDDFAIRTRKDEQRNKLSLKEGDAKGWNSTADYQKDLKSTIELNKILEANAIKRGDKVLSR